MTDIRRALLWGVFSISLVMLWDAWNKHNGRPSMFDAPVAQAPAAAGSAPATAASAVTPGAVATPAGVVAGPSATVDVSTDLVKATFDTRGGSLVHLELVKHQDQTDRTQNVVLFDRGAKRLYTADTGLIPRLANEAPLPNHTTVMKLVDGPRALADGQNELPVSFEVTDAQGVTLRKTFTFQRGSYAVRVKHEVANAGAGVINPQLYLQLQRDGHVEESSMFMAPAGYTGPAVYTQEKKFQKVAFEDIAKGKADHVKTANDGWVAMVQHYFNSAWIVNDAQPREFRTAKAGENLYSVALVMPLAAVAPGASATHESMLYAGPQEENKLAALAPGLELVKDYGVLTILAKPLFWLLDKLHGLIGNWGWAIVALVVLLKIAFYWLNASAYRSMAKMKAVNPRIMELRERLKDNPQQMQQEMMKIYREEKVNPLGGCLPMVVQMPFFFALYWVLLATVEMRNAPWLGWITDLSVKDPYFVLPLLMTGTTLLTTWLNPQPADEMQRKMMWIMPLMFSVFFFFFPAGLVLYWLTNNILSIAQQYLINKQMGVVK